MKSSRLLKTLALSTSLLASACVAESDTTGDLTPVGVSGAVHMLPFQDASKLAVANAITPGNGGGPLINHGGPVLKNIHVAPLFWNSTVRFQTNVNWEYTEIPPSSFYDLFAQYGVGRGNGQAAFVDNHATVANITDAAIQSEVLTEINAGHLPPPNANNYYPVHFPPGMNITAPDGSKSCVQFCAYHSVFQVQNSAGTIFNIPYGVVPDVGNAGCAGGCGGNASTVNNETSVASHELVEATTDPALNAWFDGGGQEIGDICNGQQFTFTATHTYVLQKEWSNSANGCAP